MRISELADRSGVPLSTIKFYLREGLLPAGERSAPNQARYGEAHRRRLELIRALRDVAGLGIEVVRAVLVQLDRGWEESGDPVGEALRAACAGPPVELDSEGKALLDAAQREVYSFLTGLDWTTDENESSLYVDPIARSLVQIRRYLFPDFPAAALAPYARMAWLLSEMEYEKAPGGAQVPMPGDDLTEPTRRAVLGSILFEHIFSALRHTANAMRSIRTTAGLPIPRAKLLPSDRRPRQR